MDTLDIYKQATSIKAKATWNFGKMNACKRELSYLDFRLTKAKKWEKHIWEGKYAEKQREMEEFKQAARECLIVLKNFLNENL